MILLYWVGSESIEHEAQARESCPRGHVGLRGSALRITGLVIYLLLAGYLLFAHGCHGDEDNELFAGSRNFFEKMLADAP